MNEHQDEASEAVRAGMRTAMAAAAQIAQRTLSALEQRQREIQAASEQRAAELSARFDAERSAATAALAPVGRDDWWATARPDQIADRIRHEASARYGVEPASLDRAEQLNRDAAEERDKARGDEAAAIAIGVDTAAEANERAAFDTEYQSASQERADALWDSAERRTSMAKSLEGRASTEAVAVRMAVDTGQGEPAREAVTRRPVSIRNRAKNAAPDKVAEVRHGRSPRT